jgi:hypothetical protein
MAIAASERNRNAIVETRNWRDLALFNLAIDSKHRASDLVILLSCSSAPRERCLQDQPEHRRISATALDN